MNHRVLRNPPTGSLQVDSSKQLSVGDRRAIMPNKRFRVDKDCDSVELEPSEIVQRNWSRVGIGNFSKGCQESAPCFIKQYLDATGQTHPDHLHFEYEGVLLARKMLGEVVNVPKLLFKDEQRVLNVFERVNLITVDELLREKEQEFWHYYPLLLEVVSDTLEKMTEAAARPESQHLPRKARPYKSQALALNFKGFEIRNTGFELSLNENKLHAFTDLPPVVMFDFVRPYLAPIEEAAAKLLISIGLLNWGKPLKRFIKGPDRDMLDIAFYYFGHMTSREALDAELNIQYKSRYNDTKGATRSEKNLKRAGLNVLGSRYLRKLEHWIDAYY